MQLEKAIHHIFLQLEEALHLISNEQFSMPCQHLFDATIGQHCRHIIEMFQCLEMGYETGVVNYENRKRERSIETDKEYAVALMHSISKGLSKPNKNLLLQGAYHITENDIISFDTNYYREIAYNMEHAIHHMALIKVGFAELVQINLSEGFGVASSTVKYQKSCAL